MRAVAFAQHFGTMAIIAQHGFGQICHRQNIVRDVVGLGPHAA